VTFPDHRLVEVLRPFASFELLRAFEVLPAVFVRARVFDFVLTFALIMYPSTKINADIRDEGSDAPMEQ
jgi:hypothetical protein